MKSMETGSMPNVIRKLNMNRVKAILIHDLEYSCMLPLPKKVNK